MASNAFQLSDGKFLGLSRDHQRYIFGGFFFLLGLFSLLSVAFSQQDRALFGTFGAAVRSNFTLFFGHIVAYLLPLLLMYWSFQLLRGKNVERLLVRLIALSLFTISLCSLLSLPFYNQPELQKRCLYLGGLIGNFVISDWGMCVPFHIGIVGSTILFFAILVPSLLIATDFLFFQYFKAGWSWIGKRYEERKSSSSRQTAEQSVTPSKPRKKARADSVFKRGEPNRVFTPDFVDEIDDKVSRDSEDSEIDIIDPLRDIIKDPDKKESVAEQRRRKQDYQQPPISLLREPPPVENVMSDEEIQEKSEILERTLADFGIEAKVVQVTQGPVVTLFALQPAAGVKINRIVRLENDLAMVLRAIKVRILAPIPGKAAVGIEVPNRKVTGVYLKEILTCAKMKKARSPLAFCLGKTIAGEPFVGDLSKMPHLLIAGATGSGKSVCLNSIIASVLFRQTPDQVKFIIIDPKRVEMSVYQAIPHLMAPVVCETRKAASALSWAVEQMEERYKILAGLGVRNIDSFNTLANSDKPHKKLMGKEIKYMPHLVIVIDELADLMMIARNEVEEYVIRLAQLARAVGIHLVIATQRPSVNVITGIIKANFPSRIAFQVSSKVDSRTIIDMNGAETLLGRGDMLFYHAGAPKPIRIQGAFVSEQEIEDLTDFIKEQQKAIYVKEDFDIKQQEKSDQIAETAPRSSRSDGDVSDEELYEQALRMVLENNKASVSMIQRRLKIGYARAGRLMDMMEEEGIVGPYQGSKPRDLLVDPAEELAKIGAENPLDLVQNHED